MKTLPPPDALIPCTELLRTHAEGVILAPTETVYGLLCAYENQAARSRIYTLKHRPASKQLAVFLPDLSFVPRFAPPLAGRARRIAEAFMPGPVTLVVPDGKGSTFGFRIPDHPFILALLRQYGGPIASTSANRSGEPPALDLKDALRSLDGEPDLAVDGGALPPDSLASTVILMKDDDSFQIVRQGPVTEQLILRALA